MKNIKKKLQYVTVFILCIAEKRWGQLATQASHSKKLVPWSGPHV